jgi:hypothetical protein
MTQEYPSEFLLTVSGIQHRVPRRTLSAHPALRAISSFGWRSAQERPTSYARLRVASAHPRVRVIGRDGRCRPSPQTAGRSWVIADRTYTHIDPTPSGAGCSTHDRSTGSYGDSVAIQVRAFLSTCPGNPAFSTEQRCGAVRSLGRPFHPPDRGHAGEAEYPHREPRSGYTPERRFNYSSPLPTLRP